MHGSQADFLHSISGFLGCYYLFLAVMNAVVAYRLWHHRHRTEAAVFWVAVSCALTAVAALSMGGTPLGLPAGLRNAINEATGPVIYSVGTTLLLVLAFLFRRFLVQPMVGW